MSHKAPAKVAPGLSSAAEHLPGGENVVRRKIVYLALSLCLGCLVLDGNAAFSQLAAARDSSQDSFGHVKIKTLSSDAGPELLQRVEAIKQIPADTFEARQFKSRDGITLPYRLLKPQNYQPKVKYPIVIVFHGSGAMGQDNVQQLGLLAKSWAQPEYREKYPCFVVVPQFSTRPVEYFTRERSSVNVSRPLPPLQVAVELIESLVRRRDVDRRRIYVMGFSMGGSSTWEALMLRPKMFAAAVPVAGMPDAMRANRLPDIPLWIIHGNNDHENPFEGDWLMYQALNKKGAKSVRFWELEGIDHEFPPRLLTSGELPQWLFRQRRARRA